MKTVTAKQVIDNGDTIRNAMLEELDVNLLGHSGNDVSLVGCCALGKDIHLGLFPPYNLTGSIGYILKAIFALLGVSEESGKRLSSVENIPIRIILKGSGGWGSGCDGIGHFLEDKFIYTKDLMREGGADNENNKEQSCTE